MFATRRPANPAKNGALSRPSESRILRSVEFKAVYDNGNRLSGPLFAAFCLARPHSNGSDSAGSGAGRSTARLGLTVPRAVGGAVVRNRIKRRIRELFRLHRAEIGPQWDIVINPRKAAWSASFEQLDRAFRKVIEKCGP